MPELQNEQYWARYAACIVNTALTNEKLVYQAAPHAYHLAEILRPWVDGKIWTDKDWHLIPQIDSHAHFHAFYDDYLVLLAETGKIDRDVLIFGEAGVTYKLLHKMEDPYWRGRMKRMMTAIERVYPDKVIARTIFICVFFIAHYWWDLYLVEDEMTSPLLNAWKELHEDDSEDEFVMALASFSKNYPPVRKYKERIAPGMQPNWTIVRDTVREIQKLLSLGESLPENPMSCHLYARAITQLYLSESLRYAPDKEERNNSQIQHLIKEARELFQKDDDDFHVIWAIHDQADALSEEADEESLDLAQKCCEEGIERALKLKTADSDEESLDTEVIACFYTIQANIAWKRGNQAAAWGLMAASSYLAYMWKDLWSTQGDRYAFEFYGEKIERTLDYLEYFASINETEAADVSEFLWSFWQPDYPSAVFPRPTLQPFSSATVQRLIFPLQPNPDRVATEKAKVKELLNRTEQRLFGITKIFPNYPLPGTFAQVVSMLIEEFPSDTSQEE